jgi:excisionase family DNA binding protein
VSIAEASELLNVHHHTLRRWVSAGRITGYRLGPRLLRVKLADVENLARQLPTA